MIEHERPGAQPATSAEAESAPLPPLPTSLDRDVRIRRGAGWLVWIAGLTAVNIVLVVAQSDHTFAAGIFLSQGIAVIGASIASEAGMPAIGYVAAALALGPALGSLLAYFPARRGNVWALGIALALYALDTLLLLGLMAAAGEADIIGLGIHALAVYQLFSAWRAAREPETLAVSSETFE